MAKPTVHYAHSTECYPTTPALNNVPRVSTNGMGCAKSVGKVAKPVPRPKIVYNVVIST
jgi:hypothetical protein